MDMPSSGQEIQTTSEAPTDEMEKKTRTATRAPSIIVGTVAAIVVALSVFYLLRREPPLVPGAAVATRVDIAARGYGGGKGITLRNDPACPAGGRLGLEHKPQTLRQLRQ